MMTEGDLHEWRVGEGRRRVAKETKIAVGCVLCVESTSRADGGATAIKYTTAEDGHGVCVEEAWQA